MFELRSFFPTVCQWESIFTYFFSDQTSAQNRMARSTRSSAVAHKIVSQGQFNGNHYEIKRDGSSTFLSVRLEENVKRILHIN